MKLLACNSNKILSQEIAKYLGVELVNADVKKFADNEIFVEIKENVRGEDIFVIQSTSYPANDHIMDGPRTTSVVPSSTTRASSTTAS